MLEYFTVGNVALVVSLIASFYALLKTMAPKTQSTADDKALELIDRARPWIFSFSSLAWSIVESLSKSGKIDKLTKFSEYMRILKEGFEQAFGKEMPMALESDAQLIAQGLSAAEKLDKVNSLNPIEPATAREALALKPQA